MKKILFTTLSGLLALTLTAQNQKNIYEKKRTTNAIIGWTLLTSGAVLIIAGAAMDPGEKNSAFFSMYEYKNSGDKIGMYLGGATLIGGSLFFFEWATRNKEKAMEVGLTKETVTLLKNGSFVKSSIPAISLKLKL